MQPSSIGIVPRGMNEWVSVLNRIPASPAHPRVSSLVFLLASPLPVSALALWTSLPFET